MYVLSIVLWMECHHLTFFTSRLERKRNGRKVGAILIAYNNSTVGIEASDVAV